MTEPKKDDTLTGATAVQEDTRPRFQTVQIPGGPARIRRLQPEQIYAQLMHFKRHGIDAAEPVVTDTTRPELRKLVQRCLVPVDTNKLIFPGVKGFLKLGDFLTDEQLLNLAIAVIKFQEL